MRDLNSNLAAERHLLTEMMDGKNTYGIRDGSVIEVPMEQLQVIWDVCDDSERIRLRIPFYVGTDISGEGSSWKVEGTAEAAVVAKLLGKKIHREGYLRLYHPDIKQLKSMISDCFLMMFTP